MLRRTRTLAHWFLIAVALVASPCTCCLAATTEVPVALLADPHFDPFRDVSKVPRLAAAPVDQWSAILGEPAAPSDAKAFRDLQTACNEGSVDAANDLMLSAFHAAAQKNAEGAPAFVLLAGDLLVHRFDCRYEKLLGHPAAAPGTKYDDAEAHPASGTATGVMLFAQKTISYIALQLHASFPHTPVYIALGNNDSGCGDYQLNEGDPLLSGTGSALAGGWIGASAADAAKASADYGRLGSYSLPLPAPLLKGRVLVLDDLYLSGRYNTCKGKPDSAAATDLIAWVDRQLTEAEHRGEFVWVLTHIPPGINTYATNVNGINVCAGKAPVTFLQSTSLTAVLARHASAVRVMVAGHTHVDEIAVFGTDETHSTGSFPVKGEPSVSTVSGNPPSFVLASVDTRTGTLQDYTLHQASSAVPLTPASSLTWRTAYDFRTTYTEPAFTAASVADLVKRFAAGAPADDQAIATYQNYFAGHGLRRLALQAVWNQYTCHMQHDDPAAFTSCVCGTSTGK